MIAYLSLSPPPALPLEATEIIASSKFHDEAAWTTLAPKTSIEGSKDRRNFIVGNLVYEVGIRGASSRVHHIEDTFPRNSWLFVPSAVAALCRHNFG